MICLFLTPNSHSTWLRKWNRYITREMGLGEGSNNGHMLQYRQELEQSINTWKSQFKAGTNQMGCKDCSVSKALSVRQRKRDHPGICRRDRCQPWKKVPIEQVTNITLWSNFLTLQIFLTYCNFAMCSTTLWLVCCLKQTDSSDDALLLLCLHYCNSLIYSSIVHCSTWRYKKKTSKATKDRSIFSS